MHPRLKIAAIIADRFMTAITKSFRSMTDTNAYGLSGLYKGVQAWPATIMILTEATIGSPCGPRGPSHRMDQREPVCAKPWFRRGVAPLVSCRSAFSVGWIASIALGGLAHAPGFQSSRRYNRRWIFPDAHPRGGRTERWVRRSPQSGITERSQKLDVYTQVSQRDNQVYHRVFPGYDPRRVCVAFLDHADSDPRPDAGKYVRGSGARGIESGNRLTADFIPCSAFNSDQHDRACGCANCDSRSDRYAATHHHPDTHTVHRRTQ